jgi:GNAT superfamily N-acetyltransferase
VPRIAELAEMGVAELRANRGGELWARTLGRRPPFAPVLRDQVLQPDHRVVVGTLDDAVFGYGVAGLDVERVDGEKPLGLVTDIYVEPGARGLGLGFTMMTDLVAWCDEQGCIGVDSIALPGDRATKNFFESFGLVARAILVHRSLP